MMTSVQAGAAEEPAISLARIEKWFGTRDGPVHALSIKASAPGE